MISDRHLERNKMPLATTIITHGCAAGFYLDGSFIDATSVKNGALDGILEATDALHLCSCEVGSGDVPSLIEERYGISVYSSPSILRGGEVWELSRGDETVLIEKGLEYPDTMTLSYTFVDSVPITLAKATVDMTPDGTRAVIGGEDQSAVRVYDISASGFSLIYTISGVAGMGRVVSISDDASEVIRMRAGLGNQFHGGS